MILVYYPKCTTCQKALKWLTEKGIHVETRHIKEENPSAQELAQWIKASGLPVKKFFNTSGLLYKEMKLKDKLPTMSEEEQIALLATDGMLVKRPILLVDGDMDGDAKGRVKGRGGCDKDGSASEADSSAAGDGTVYTGRVLVGFKEAQWEEIL